MNKWFKRFFAGMGIGTGAAIPGVSGAAIAVIFHVYEDIIDAVNNFRKKFSYAIRTLIPILLGIICAVIPCIIIFHLAFQYVMFILISIFIGFLIGSFPGITKEVKGVTITNKYKLIIHNKTGNNLELRNFSIVNLRRNKNMAEFYRKKKKICQMCAGKSVDYKDVMIVSKYINEKGKIMPRRMTGACAKHQRHIAQQIKWARFMALIPYVK